MKKLKKISVIITLITILLVAIFPAISNATNTITIYGKPRYNNLLKRNGIDLTCIPLAYKKDGQEHPVYCLNLELEGATEKFSYEVSIDSNISNMEIWRTIINGYPYKTLQELGCATKEEAYLATRQAVYCAVYGRDPNSYIAIGGEAGERTLNAMHQIVKAARTSTETKQSSTMKINSSNNKWEIDTIDSNYVSKTFEVTAAAGISDYKIELTGNLIEDMKVVDEKNIIKNEFKGNEKFKILIPISNLKQDGNFNILVKGNVATKPVLYGISGNSTLQNVAVTGSIYEDGSGSKQEYYFENLAKIVILKQNQETKEPLKGVKFNILNYNKEVIYSDLTTNEEGIVEIKNLLPGQYYIQEIETLEGYEPYERLIEVNLKLNEEVKITVNNLHSQDIPEVEKTSTELEVIQTQKKLEINQNKEMIKLPKTGM